MLFHELVNMSINSWAWAWACEHEQGNMIESFLEYFSNVDKIFLSHLGQNIWWCGKILFHVLWMNDIHGWKWGLKMTMDELFHEHSQQVLYCKKLKIEEIYVGLLWTIHHMKCSSYTWTSISYSSFVPNHIKFKITWNSKAHKPVDPPKGMCQFK
jgi:hypothetical protein